MLERLARLIDRRRRLVLAACVVVVRTAGRTVVLLIVMGLPFLRIEFTGVDASVLPPQKSARAVDDETAGFLDQQSSIGASLPLALAILATTTLVILFAMTGSVVLPVKALLGRWNWWAPRPLARLHARIGLAEA